MNIYRQLAEKVWNPRMVSAADIQRQLDLMDQLQPASIQSNIDYAVPGLPQDEFSPYEYKQENEGRPGPEPGFTDIMANDPWGWQTMAKGLTGYGFNMPKDVEKDRFPSPFGRLSGLPATVMNQIAPTGPVGGLWSMAFRNALNPLMARGLDALGIGNRGYPFSPTPTPTFDVDWEGRQTIPGFDPTRDVDWEGRQSIPGFDPTRDVDWEGRQGIPGFDIDWGGYPDPGGWSRGFSQDQFGMIDWGGYGQTGYGDFEGALADYSNDDSDMGGGTSTGW